MSSFPFQAQVVDGPVFFQHKNKAPNTADIANMKIAKYYKTPDEIAEWEKLMLDQVGLKVDGNAIIAGGGSCCGTGGGSCDAD